MSGDFFLEHGWQDHHAWLPDTTYGEVLDSVVFGCADMSLIDEAGRISVVTRVREPQASDWCIGGRMIPGDAPAASAARNLKRETGLELPTDRFHYIGTYSTCWATRAQPPEGHGCHGLIMHFAVPVSKEEIARIRLDPGEYQPTIRFYDANEIISRVERGDLHPIFRSIAQDIARLKTDTGEKGIGSP